MSVDDGLCYRFLNIRQVKYMQPFPTRCFSKVFLITLLNRYVVMHYATANTHTYTHSIYFTLRIADLTSVNPTIRHCISLTFVVFNLNDFSSCRLLKIYRRRVQLA